MVDLDAPFFHHLLELTVADRICDVPAHAQRIISRSKWLPLKSITAPPFRPSEAPAIPSRDRVGQNLATEPTVQPSSSARRCQRQSRSSRQGFALISTATPSRAQACRT